MLCSLLSHGDAAWYFSLDLDGLPRLHNHNDHHGENDVPAAAQDGEGDFEGEDNHPDREDRKLAERQSRIRLAESVFCCFHIQDRLRIRVSYDPEKSRPYKNFLLFGHHLFHQLLVHI